MGWAPSLFPYVGKDQEDGIAPACSHLSSLGAWGLHSHTNPAHSPFPFPGRSPELREDLIESFHQLALEMGIPEDSIFILANRGDLPWAMCLTCCQSTPGFGSAKLGRQG